MGCVAKTTKRAIHTFSQPTVTSSCGGCGACVDFCPQHAISLQNGKAKINYALCYGCGICITKCPNRALQPKKGNLRVLLANAAYAVLKKFGEKQMFINVLFDISPLCDCFPIGGTDPGFPVVKDIGITVSTDCVSIDAASLYLVEKTAGKKVFYELHNIDPWEVVEAGHQFGLGEKDFRIVEV